MPFNKKKIIPINYTSRDFDSIKRDLVNHVKRYYSDTYKDFNEGSFGSMMLDTVSYVGDILSYYLDYHVNESYLETAIEYDNVVKLARQLGYKWGGYPVSSGIITMYVVIPAASSGVQPDLDYAPIIKRGTKFSTSTGIVFTLNEDVDFSDSDNEVVVATVNSTTGVPTGYAIKAKGEVISGEISVVSIDVGNYERFKRVKVGDSNISEIVSVVDNNGNEYFEVGYLSQDTIYVPVKNVDSDNTTVPYIMKPQRVPRRFVFERSRNDFFLQFGYGSETNLTNEKISDPSKVIMDVNGRDYITDTTFDPTNLIETDKLGVAPQNTTLTVTYRSNSVLNVNIGSKALVSLSDPRFSFSNIANLNAVQVTNVIKSLEFENEDPIVGSVTQPSTEEIKYRAYGAFNSQNRAVTKEDFKSVIYSMPAKFGAVKRCNIVQDQDSFKRNLNLYVVSEDGNGKLTSSTENLKRNLKNYLSNYKMINDTIDILDARVANVGIQFDIIADPSKNKFDVLQRAVDAIKTKLVRTNYEIGEPISLTDIFRILKEEDGILDVISVKIVPKRGGNYSSFTYNVKENTSPDGRMLYARDNVIFEIKYPDSDILGTVR